MRVVNRQVPTPFRDIDLDQLLRPNFREFVASALKLPFRARRLARTLAGAVGPPVLRRRRGHRPGREPAVGPVLGRGHRALRAHRARPIPTAPTTSACWRTSSTSAATDLDTCERIVFGAEGWDDVPISTAVRASTALPMVYKPVEIKDRELVDGGIVSTTNVDIAVEAGAKFVVVINPLVPYVNDFKSAIPTLIGSRAGASRTWASRRSATRRSS